MRLTRTVSPTAKRAGGASWWSTGKGASSERAKAPASASLRVGTGAPAAIASRFAASSSVVQAPRTTIRASIPDNQCS
jgi:hypothetical protein